MPIVCEAGPFQIFVNNGDHEPAHVHVVTERRVVIVLIGEAVELRETQGKPTKSDIRKALQAVADNLDACNAKWKEIYPDENRKGRENNRAKTGRASRPPRRG